MYALLPDAATGLIRTALALRSGWMRRFRAQVRQVIAKRLVIYKTGTPLASGSMDPVAHRNFLTQLFFSTCAADELEALSRLCNGDWQCSSQIQHFCGGPHCCSSTQDTLSKMTYWLLRIFCKGSPRIFPRHKWNGSDETVDYFGRMQAVHSLFSTVISELFGSEATNEDLVLSCGAVH